MAEAKIDLNSDLGESFGRYKLGYDEDVMTYISSANIACGFHAGDPVVMDYTVNLAKENGVGIGAHPGYPDLQGFGRRSLALSGDEAEKMVIYQIGAIQAIAKSLGAEVRHVKAHGAFGNDTQQLTEKGQEHLAIALGNAVKKVDPSLKLIGFMGSRAVEIWRDMGLEAAEEIFADRAYNPDGTLVSRRLPGSVIHEPEKVIERVLQMVMEKRIVCHDGSEIKNINADTICVHSDTVTSLELVKVIRAGLEEKGIKIERF